MPGRDGTGPMGQGSMTGRGLGVCTGVNVGRYGVGLGRGFGRGMGRSMGLGMGFGYGCRRGAVRFYAGGAMELTDKEILNEQKELFQKRLDVVSRQLENLQESNK